MGNSFGTTRTLFTERFGRSIQVSADGAPKYKAGGITVSWANVPACPATVGNTYYGATVQAGVNGGANFVEFADGVIVEAGKKAIRYGTVMVYDATLDLQPVTDGDPNGAYKPAPAGTLARSQSFIVNETWLEEDTNSNHIGVMDGGRMWRARIVCSDLPVIADPAWTRDSDSSSGPVTVYATGGATPPTLAQIETAMPLVVWALDN